MIDIEQASREWARDGDWRIAPAGVPWIAEGARIMVGERASVVLPNSLFSQCWRALSIVFSASAAWRIVANRCRRINGLAERCEQVTRLPRGAVSRTLWMPSFGGLVACGIRAFRSSAVWMDTQPRREWWWADPYKAHLAGVDSGPMT